MKDDFFAYLYKKIESRRFADINNSYVARIFAAGENRIAQKIGEEGVEVAIATLTSEDSEFISEVADLIFHLHIAMVLRGVSMSYVIDELKRRDQEK